MKWIKTSLLLFIASLGQTSDIPEQVYGRIGLRALVLSTEKPNGILTSLASYGIAYDNLIYNCENPLEDELYLLDETTGNPKYNMIIIANGGMLYKCNGSVVSALQKKHWEDLNMYEAKYNIRSVVFNEDNDFEEIGIKPFEYQGDKQNRLSIIPADNSFTHSLFDTAGVYETAPLDTFSINYKLASITDESKSTPVLYYDLDNGSNEKPVAAVYSVLNNGNEVLTFFMSSNKRSVTSLIINHLWIPWASKYIYTGFRRIYLTQHIDDIFSSETLVTSSEKYPNSNTKYKNTIDDINNIIQYQNDIVKKMPEGSSYRLEFAFNGYGLIDDSIYKFNMYEDPDIPNDYIKVKGSGTSRWPNNSYSVNWLEEELNKNPFYAFIKKKEKNKNFFWCSHGFTHQNLNQAVCTDVQNQISTNIKMAARLGIYEANFSTKTFITTRSSGLHNVDVIEVFLNNSIASAAGNIYRVDITNDEFYEKNAYLPWRTTEKSSNIDGFPVIPRIPAMILSQCSTPLENTIKYNKMFEGTGIETSFDEIINRDSQQALLYLLQLRHNPFQFHQTNLRNADLPNKKSLVEIWTQKLIEKYNQYVKWPIVSLKVDDIHNSFFEREQFEKCDLEQKLVYNNTHIIAISLISRRACKVPIALPEGIGIKDDDLHTYKEKLSVEQINEADPITLWVDINDDFLFLNFSPAIEWGKFHVTTRYNTLAARYHSDDYYFKKDYENGESQTEANTSTAMKDIPSSHNIVKNIITNVLRFNSISKKMINKYGYTTEQLRNPKAFKELEKSRMYVENLKIHQDTAKDENYISNNLRKMKSKFYNS